MRVHPNRESARAKRTGGLRRPLVIGIGGTMRPGSMSLAALRQALAAAEAAGAATKLFDLRQLDLPVYDPERPLAAHGESVRRFVRALREADALLVSTAAYQGTVAGITKNALDYAEFLAGDDPPYLTGKPVGLIATAAGSQAAPNAIATLVQVAHALRAVVVPFTVPIPRAWGVFPEGDLVAEEPYGRRLDELGRMVVELARRLRGDGGIGSQRTRTLDGDVADAAARAGRSASDDAETGRPVAVNGWRAAGVEGETAGDIGATTAIA